MKSNDWAEKIVFNAINKNSEEYFAVKYGRSESIAAGDDGFADFYTEYQQELNTIGKRPDLLIFKSLDFINDEVDIENDEHISKAIAALEIRSSSFLVKKYNNFMTDRQEKAILECSRLKRMILEEPYLSLLKRKNINIFNIIQFSSDKFRDLDFRLPSWSVTKELRELKDLLRVLKENIKILHRRDYLSITPKMEDIALVNRWIQKYNVKHYYLQVFFDKAYVISFKEILELVSNDENEEKFFSIEQDVKNQQKTTIKVNIQVGKEILGRIDMPNHKSSIKELDRGRLLF
ncbi:MAG: AccI family restriction endonuclease [Saprospiraceae bacterium]|nr:AccI family restriction endonuclease [Saprospiraceae bacterium]